MSVEVKPEHSKIGASSMERWSKCPGSVRLSEGMPNVSSKFAMEGTRAHELAADWLQKGILPPDNTDEETYVAIELYVEYLKARFKTFERHDNTKWFIEHKFDLTSIYPNLYGTADSVMYDGKNKTLYVDDLKFGKGIPVDAENNPQLMYYGIGALESTGLPVSKIVLTIIQPRYSSDIRDAVKSVELDPLDLMDFRHDLKVFAEETTKPNAAVVPGDHCQFCKAIPVCPALKKEAELAMEAAFGQEKLPSLAPADVGVLLDKVDHIENWCAGVREYAYTLSQTTKIPGYKRVPKQARRKWNDPAIALKTIEMMFTDNVIRDCLTDPELKSPAQVEKILGKDQKEFVGTLCSAVSSGDVLVPESDKRPEITSSMKAEIAFGDLEMKGE